MSESEIEGRSRYLGRCLLLDPRRLIRAGRLDVRETKDQTSVRLLRRAVMSLARVHLFHRRLETSCRGRGPRSERRGDNGIEIRLRTQGGSFVALGEGFEAVRGIVNGLIDTKC